jgi:predicted short-subunit dehydrogenase-like oxidoreductase (DUF2520 family)
MTALLKTLNIIGCGNLGKTLGRLWADAGSVTIQDVLNRSTESAAQAIAYIGAGRPSSSFMDLRPADIFLLACSDDQITACCDALAATGVLLPGTVVFHCSGALRSSTLMAAANHGALIASVHPIRSFAAPDQVIRSFSGTYCGTEGNLDAIAILENLFSAIGGILVPIDADAKTVYHSAAVFASNYLVTLIDVSLDAYLKAGIPRETALRLMEPLVRETVDNIFRLGPADALSGPIARGDVKTVVRQYRAVKIWDKRRAGLYKLMGKLTSEIAKRRARSQGVEQ